MSKITICTTTYNRENLLQRTVNSVLSQTFNDFDYLIINNGSTDNTQLMIDNICKEDKRIRFVTHPFNSKDTAVSRERWQEIKQGITTPYYMKIDDDDYMEHNTVETLYNLIRKHDADVACVGSKCVFPDGTMKDKFVFNGMYVYNRVEAMTEMLKREKINAAIGAKLLRTNVWFKDIDYPDVSRLRDIHISYRRMNNVNKMVVSGEPLYYFSRHDKNMSGLDSSEQITPEKLKQHLEANTMRTQWLSEHMPEIKDYVFYCELSFMISLYERINRLDVKDCFRIADEMKDTLIRNMAFLEEHNFCSEREKGILKNILS